LPAPAPQQSHALPQCLSAARAYAASASALGARTCRRRRNGAGSQILADLGVHRLRVLGTPRRQVGLGGFGLEVVEYV
jgi:3,4-dihydroxy 2-butanone 4-phosphate synthase / GTP cyclohydrolase II